MNRRTKILAGMVGACLAYVLISSVAYPRWIEPLLTIDKRVAEREKDLDELENMEADVHLAKLEYRDLLDRMGSFDPLKVQNDLRERLNELIERHKLENANTSPSRAQEDRKTRITTLQITVTGVGTLESVMGFMKDVSVFPQLIRIGNASIYPASSSRKDKDEDLVNIRVPIEVKILPQQRIMDQRLTDADLSQPEAVIRHEDRDYSPIWTGQHFTEVIPLKPLVVDAGKDMTIALGQRHTLRGKAKGGDGEYTYQWIPEVEVSDPSTPHPTVNTDEPGERVYTLTVSDGSGNTAEDSVTITVRDRQRRGTAQEPEKVVEREPVDNRWKDRRYLQLRMALLSSAGDQHLDEVMVFDNKGKKSSYYAVGSDFDGGKLVYVHPRGGVVHREGEYFVCPIGSNLDQDIPVDEAVDYPILQVLALRLREAERSSPGEAAPAAGDRQDDVPAVPGVESAPETGTVNEAADIPGEAKMLKDSATFPVPKESAVAGAAKSNEKDAESSQLLPGGKKGDETPKATGAAKGGEPSAEGKAGNVKAAKPLPGDAKNGAAETEAETPLADQQSGNENNEDGVTIKTIGNKRVKVGTPADKKVGRKGGSRARH